MITKYIGQTPIIASLNEMLQGYEKEKAAKKDFAWRPIFLGGWTGTGKSALARALSEQLQKFSFNYIEVPINAGMRDLYSVFGKICAEDGEGNISAIPHIVLWDEFQSQKKETCDIFKAMTTEVEKVHTVRRQGFNFHFDPFNHIHILASNNIPDKAVLRRCRNFVCTTYTPAEMARMATLFLSRHEITLDDSGMEALLSRCKPLAGDLEELVSPLVSRSKASGKHKLNGEIVTDVLRSQGYFPKGLRRADISIINQLVNGPATSAVLKFKCQDDKKKDTQERVDYLGSIGLVEPVRGGHKLTKNGFTYADEIVKAQKAARAAKAAKK